MKKKSWLSINSLLLALASTALISCDKDFTGIGADLVNEDYMNFNRYSSTDIQAGYTKSGAVSTSNLAVNTLGVLNNGNLGKAEYHFATQLTMDEYAPEIGSEPQIDSVYLYIPYFSTVETTNADASKEYVLDSIYGSGNFDLKVYESGYYMSSIDPNTSTGARLFYSDDKPLFDNSRATLLNTSTNVAQNSQFSFSNKEMYIYKKNDLGQFIDKSGTVLADNAAHADKVVLETFKPGMWLDLNNAFFQTKILNSADANLATNAAFANYFRGLYFNVAENQGSTGALGTLNFSEGYIQVKYKYKDSEGNRVSNSIKLKLTGQTVNLIENNYNYIDQSPEKLYVVGGGKGSGANTSDSYITYLDLFGPDLDANGFPDKIDFLKEQNWLINEVNVTLFVDRDAITNSALEPQRLYLYDINNSKTITDYDYDTSTNTSNTKNNKGVYNGILVSSDDKGLYYRFRITEYVKSLITGTTKLTDEGSKYRLGLSTTESIALATFTSLKSNANTLSLDKIPTAAVMAPLGTVLYSPSVTDEDKKIKLEIFYTKPN